MIDATVVEMARRTNLINLVGSTVELRRESSTEWAGPCPLCGGTDRLHVRSDVFFCRQCHPDFGDPIEYIRWLHRLNFADAVQRLTGEATMQATTKVQPAAKAPAAMVQAPDWLAKATAIVGPAQERIDEQAPAAYRQSRGLSHETVDLWCVGYRPDAPLPGTWDARAKRHIVDPAPALVIPWYRGGKLAAVRYRFFQTHEYTDVDGKARTAKLTSVPGSDFTGLLYGDHMLPSFVTLPLDGNGKCAEALRTLVIVEGEINAMSIWQVANGWRWDVLSLGSESQKLPDGGRLLAERYGRTIVWMDKADVAKKMMSQIPGSVAISSPIVDGRKVDANDMVQTGQLADFLVDARQRACRNDEERERIKWDLWEATHAN